MTCLVSKTKCLTFVTILFSITIQIQISLFTTADYVGLRINLADFLLPFAGIIILVSLLIKKMKWPQWEIKNFYFWILGFVVILTISLIQGYFTNGFFSQWALINKYIGFFILLSYMGLGAYIATNADSEEVIRIFIKAFSLFFIIILAFSFSSLTLENILSLNLWIGHYPWDGFMANRNAFMVSAIFTMILIEVYRGAKNNPIPSWAGLIFWVLMPFFGYFNASRTGWIIGFIILFIIFLRRPSVTLKKIIPLLCLGAILCTFYISFFNLDDLKPAKQFSRLGELVQNQSVNFEGDKKRIIDIQDGWALYRSANPFLGAGLGSYAEFDSPNRSQKYAHIIDFTALWLLVETGILGLSFFGAFFLLCLWIFYKRGFFDQPSLFHRTLFFFLITFLAMSFLHELTYTRFIWFALGFALVTPNKKLTPLG